MKLFKKNKLNYYKNIELVNSRFQEFAFATHPDAYDPKKMSELPIKDLALIGLSPDFKEWIGEGAHGTWLQAAIVAGNLDYITLLASNISHYNKIENNFIFDAWKVIKDAGKKIVHEAFDLLMREDVEKFIEDNRIRNEK